MTTTVTPEQHLTVVKHLAAGKGIDVVATLTHLDRSTVVDIGSKHGYPDTEKLSWAVDILQNKIDQAAAPTEHPSAAAIAARPPQASPTASRVGRALTTGSVEPLTRPDEIRVLINAAKGHPSKRIQAAADKLIDAVDRLKTLIHEDQEKNAEKRRAAVEKAAVRAEVDRLEQQLAEAKAKLRGSTPKPPPNADAPTDGGSQAAAMRAWARDNGIACSPRGMVPVAVREAYEAAHGQVAS